MRKYKFHSDWLEKTDSLKNNVSALGKNVSESGLFCSMCSCSVNFEAKGFQAVFNPKLLTKHHKSKFEIKCRPHQLHLELSVQTQPSSSVHVPTIQMLSTKDSSTTVELI